MKKTVLVVSLIASSLLLLTACDLADMNNLGGAGDLNSISGILNHSHVWSDWSTVQEADCINSGIQERSCSCGEKETQSSPDAPGHEYESSVLVEATCAQDGVSNFVCKRCGNSYSETFSAPKYSANEIFTVAEAAVGEIITYDKSGKELALGTGFVYASDGQIVTNYHVIEDAYSASITIKSHKYNVKKILAYDKDIDVAVLKVDGVDMHTLPICKAEHAVGNTVYAFGSSKGLTATFSQGIITHSNRLTNSVAYVQHDAAISSGNSGGPLINEYGEIIGINTFTVRDSQNLNFAISIKELDNLVYDSPLTFKEFYEKECDAFTKLTKHIIEKGTYDASDKEYSLVLGTSYSSSGESKYTRKAIYSTEKDEIQLWLFINAEYGFNVALNDVNGVYEWWYVDDTDYYMYGTLYADTYDSDTLLGIENHNITYTSLLTSTRKLASSMASLLFMNLNSDLASIDLTAADLGFVNY